MVGIVAAGPNYGTEVVGGCIMQNPRASGAGPVSTGAKARKSLGGDDLLLPQIGPESQRRYWLAPHFDLAADALLFVGRHDIAERLARRAAELQRATR